MDLNSILEIARPKDRSGALFVDSGTSWLAGGTWLFSEPQPRLRRLIDLAGFDWPPLTRTPDGLTIAATCTIGALHDYEYPLHWRASPLFAQCCRAFLASFKILNVATVGGNICLALPAGPMIALCAALEGICTIWCPDGSERRIPVAELVIGPQQTTLAPGELLRAVDLPTAALTRRTAFRRLSLTPLGRSAALLIGTLSSDGAMSLTVTGSVGRPIILDFKAMPDRHELDRTLAAAVPFASYYDDPHGRPDWRQHVTRVLAEEIRSELAEHDA